MTRKKAAPAEAPAPPTTPLTAPHPVVGDGGAGAPPLSPGHLMGIPMAPETQAEHAARLGDRAGTFADAGFLMGTDTAGGVGTPPVVEPLALTAEPEPPAVKPEIPTETPEAP